MYVLLLNKSDNILTNSRTVKTTKKDRALKRHAELGKKKNL
jgi:hypothetical protein